MREDLEEMLFRWVEARHGEPAVRRRVTRALRLAIRAAIVERERLGTERLFSQLEAAAGRWARWRAPRLARALGVDSSDMRELGRIQDWEDELLGVTGHWTKESATCATKHETACPFSDLASREPRVCTGLAHTLEVETFRALRPDYRLVPLTRLLSRGDDRCDFRHELGASSARSASDGAE